MKTISLIAAIVISKIIFCQCSFEIKPLHIGCADNCKGTAIIQNAEGKEPFTFHWSNGQTSKVATSLCADSTYWAIITDANNCKDTAKIIMRSKLEKSIACTTNETIQTVKLTGFSFSDCKTGDFEPIESENNVVIEEFLTTNCCLKFKGDASYRNDTLYLTAIEVGFHCRCLCTYKLNFEIKGLTTECYEVVLLKEWNSKDEFLLKFLRLYRKFNPNYHIYKFGNQ